MSSPTKDLCEQLVDEFNKEENAPLKKRLRSFYGPDRMVTKASLKVHEDEKPEQLSEANPDNDYEDHAKTTESGLSDVKKEPIDDGWPSERKQDDDPMTSVELESPDEPSSWKPISDLSNKEKKLRKHYWNDMKNDLFTWKEIQDFIFDDDLDKDIKIGVLESELRAAHSRITDLKTEVNKRNCLIDHWRNEMETLRDKVDELEEKLAEDRAHGN